jgi:tetratricopeptide (TPR) repeat protein
MTLIFVLCVGVFIFYIYFLAPTIHTGDSGELIACAKILGIPHAPGYPLYTLLGKFFINAIPFGNIAYRVNVGNALLAVACFYVSCLLFSKIEESGLESKDSYFLCGVVRMVCPLILIFSYYFSDTATAAEVFVLNTLFTLLIIYFTFYHKGSVIKRACFVAFLYGVGLGNHHTLVFLLPSVVLYFFANTESNKTRILLASIIFFMIGFSVYLALPIRSVKDPGFDVGDPQTINRLYRVILRKDYGTFALTVGGKQEYTLKNIVLQATRYCKHLASQVTIVGIILGVYGVIVGVKQDRRNLFLLLSFLLSGMFFFVVANLPVTPETEGILPRFYLMSLAIFMIYIYIGAKRLKLMALPLVIIILLLQFLPLPVKINKRDYYLTYDYGRNLLRTLPHNAILFMDGGDDTFYSLGYLIFAEGRRKDVELHDRGGVVFKSIYGEDFRRLPKEDKEARRISIEKKFIPLRPVFYSTFNDKVLPSEKITRAGILYRVGENIYPMEEFYILERSMKKYYDYRSNALVPIYYYMSGIEKPAVEMLWQLVHICRRWPEVLWLRSNCIFKLHEVAYKLYNESRYDIAEMYYNGIISIDADNVMAWLNLGVLYERKKNFPLAKECYRKVLSIEPQNLDAYFNLAVVYWNEGDWENVVKNFEHIVNINPDYRNAKYYLEAARRRLLSSNMQK